MRGEDEQPEVRVGSAYPFAQLARAFATAADHPDAETRRRAGGRVAQWNAVLRGMLGGTLKVGSRTPVEGLPAWVTPEVVRGGFATGAAAAAGDMTLKERLVARRAKVPPRRAALFAHYVTEEGLAELDELLTSRAYAIDVPEDAALLAVAWLVGAGDLDGAHEVTEAIAPFADRLLFLPRAAEPDPREPGVVSRQTVADARGHLAARGADERIETMREALTVWNPYADEVLSLWLETVQDGRAGAALPGGWRERGAALLARYDELAAAHTRCTKHRRPKENLAILRAALADAVAGRELDGRRHRLLQHAVDSMVRRRGAPGSPEHARVRAAQAADAALPTHHALARLVVTRLEAMPQVRGVESLDPLVAPVTAEEAAATGLPPGVPIPASVRDVVARALEGTPERLVEQGVITSAEVLAELVPRVAAATVASAYEDSRLRALMAATYEAFRRRRSLLLLDLERQVALEELPWARALMRHRRGGAEQASAATATLTRLAELTLDAFPATIVPSPLVTELGALAAEAGLELPLVEELAADIFMGTFSVKFLRAAQHAGRMLRGSLYERYYGIDYDQVLALDDVAAGRNARTSPAFDALCHARRGVRPGGRSTARNGAVIEQAQVLTTHNLAVLTAPPVGARVDWAAAARRCFDAVVTLVGRLHGNPAPLRTVKDAAYAWRQMVFFLARQDEEAQRAFVAWAHERVAAARPAVAAPLAEALGGLAEAVEGGTPSRVLYGWALGPHWVLVALGLRVASED
jgi:hypothetical protein